jgi:cytochrome bd-type quinol oxidase subunit 1
MMAQERKQHGFLLSVMLVLGSLGTGGLAVSIGLSAYQNQERFDQVDAEKRAFKFSYSPVVCQSPQSFLIPNSNVCSVARIRRIEENIIFSKLEQRASVHSKLVNQQLRMMIMFVIGTLSSFLTSILMFRQVKDVTFTGYLLYSFPEEIISELAALREQLTKQKRSTWLIRSILFYQILTLVWGIYIQINIDNLTLPSRDRRIDK